MAEKETERTARHDSIYGYDDYRQYLRDRYEARQAADPDCSARSFAREAGFSNPGFFNDVVKGRRKLSADARAKMAAAFKLSASEAEYFDLLVQYAQCKSDADRQRLFSKIKFRQNRSAFSRLNPALSKYYQDFRYPLVRAALMALDFRGDCEALSRFIHPTIAPQALKKYVQDLCDWGIVKQAAGGRYEVTERFIEPAPTQREHVRQLNREWMMLAVEGLMNLPAEKRHASTMLLAVSPQTCRAIAERIEKFREDVWDMVRNDPQDPGCVMQLNVQYVPRSRAKERT